MQRRAMNLFKRFKKQNPPAFLEGELPLRAELFSAAQMEQHGGILAARHTLVLHKSFQHKSD